MINNLQEKITALGWKNLLKFFFLALAGLILITLAFQLIGSSFKGIGQQINAPAFGVLSSDSAEMSLKAGGMAYDQALGLSARNISPAPPMNDGSTGNTAEEFEVTEYNAAIETGQLEQTCATISGLKSLDYVIFENANHYDQGCSYTFKAERERANEVLAVIENLDPKDLIENTRSLKRLVDDYTSEVDILTKKMESINKTLEDAVNSYDEIAKIATQARDAESLSKIIDSKIRIIEKLTQERINISAQLELLSRAKANELDRVEYTFFNVSIYENKFIDAEEIGDSWKLAIKKFVRNVNTIAQDTSISLIAVILYAFQYLLYLLVIIAVLKIAWHAGKYIWNK